MSNQKVSWKPSSRACLAVAVLSTAFLPGCAGASFGGGSSAAPTPVKKKAFVPQAVDPADATAALPQAPLPASATSFAPPSVKAAFTALVLDATSKAPIKGAQIVLNSSSTKTLTDANGSCTLTANGPDTGATATAAGYSAQTLALKTSSQPLYFVLSPNLPPTEARFILTWASQPEDVDLHLIGSTNKGDFHVWWSNPNGVGVNLDVDSQNGHGPETITLTSMNQGHYSAVVSNYTDCDVPFVATNGLSNRSDALLRLVIGGQAPQEFRIPTGHSGLLWTPFSFDIDASGRVNVTPDGSFSDNCDDINSR